MIARAPVLTSALAFVAVVACGVPAVAVARNVDVNIGMDPRSLPAGVAAGRVTQFFPQAVTIHVGDTVTWHQQIPHNLDGVLFPGNRPLQPFDTFSGGNEPPAPTVTDAAGYPFFWAGNFPRWIVPRRTLLAQGGGTISSPAQVRSSGLQRAIASSDTSAAPPYVLRFTRAGVYDYVDLTSTGQHGSVNGSVTVVARGRRVPSPEAQARRGAAERERVLSELRSLARARPADARTVWVGNGTLGREIAAFVPNRLQISVGETVTFVLHSRETHSVTLGPRAYTDEIRRTLVRPDGGLNLLGIFPSEPAEQRQPIVYDGSNHGNGFLSTGLFLGLAYPTFRVRFTRPGTYPFVDVFQPRMDGEIVVS